LESRRVGAVLAAVALVVAVVLFIVLSGGDDSSSPSTTATSATTTNQSGTQNTGQQSGGGGGGKPAAEKLPTIVIRDGEAVGGVQDLTFTQGDDIRFKVESDQAWEIHFHGYDIPMDVKAGGSVTFDVPADIEGVFEVEIEQTATQIAEITVNPS
jgi:hypothetical protein